MLKSNVSSEASVQSNKILASLYEATTVRLIGSGFLHRLIRKADLDRKAELSRDGKRPDPEKFAELKQFHDRELFYPLAQIAITAVMHEILDAVKDPSQPATVRVTDLANIDKRVNVKAVMGLKPPRAKTVFEAAIGCTFDSRNFAGEGAVILRNGGSFRVCRKGDALVISAL